MKLTPADFRDVLGRFATGVTVVSCSSAGEPVGMTVSSFTSVSLDPPLISFCVIRGSVTGDAVLRAGSFAVNVLSNDQQAISTAFAGAVDDRFAGIEFLRGENGSPLLAGAIAHIECETHARHEAGDHVLVLGHVSRLSAHAGEPLLFYRGRYRGLAPATD